MTEAMPIVDDVVDGRYRVIQQIADGGMGTVFLAEHVLIKRRVALKVLHRELAADTEMVQRFMNEALAAGTLGHPNIVESTDMGFTPSGIPYIVFEYLEGALLTEEIYRVGGMSARRALKIARQIASALDAAHTAGIVHLDLKSDNVFLTDKDGSTDHAKILDFGISRFMTGDVERTNRNVVMGTPQFMAPEQITSPDIVDRRADIYALGVLLYEMLSARRPFGGDDPRILLYRIVHEEPSALECHNVPAAVERFLFDKLLRKDRTQRLQTMREVAAAIDDLLDSMRSGDSLPPPSGPLARASDASIAARKVVALPPAPAARGRGWIAASCVAALLAGAAGAGLRLAEQRVTSSSDDAAHNAVEAAAADLSAALTSQIHAATQRATALATTPMLRAGIETDASTIHDLVATESLFAASPGEIIEVFQLQGQRLLSMIRVPASAAPLVASSAARVQLSRAGSSLHVTASAPIALQRTGVGGSIAVSVTGDLTAIKRRVARDVLEATLVGLEAPIPLVDRTDSAIGPRVALRLDLPAGISANPLFLHASIRRVARGQSFHVASQLSFGLAGLFGLVLVVGLLVRLRR